MTERSEVMGAVLAGGCGGSSSHTGDGMTGRSEVMGAGFAAGRGWSSSHEEAA
jgi:hypothetical protein